MLVLSCSLALVTDQTDFSFFPRTRRAEVFQYLQLRLGVAVALDRKWIAGEALAALHAG